MYYRHTQRGTLILVGMLLTMFALFLIALSQESLRLPLLAALPVPASLLAVFHSLTVEICDNSVKCFFGIGLIRKEIPLSDIQSSRAVRNPWYSGWGIRWMPGQYWLWNVSGMGAVELQLKNGSRFRIGTDEPETLARAVEAYGTMFTKQRQA